MATDDRSLTITRVFDAPRDLVFRAWIDPDRMRNWIGPRGFTSSQHQFDVRPGGAWRLCLHQPNGGRDLWQSGVYREIDAPQRLAFTFAWDQEDGSRGNETLVTITFEERDGKTEMTFHQAVFDTTANRDGHRGGWNSSFDRLADYLVGVA